MSSLNPEKPDKDYGGNQQDEWTDYERELFDKFFRAWLQMPKDFKTNLLDYTATNIPEIPVSQIFGFTQFQAQPATTIVTDETTTSSMYTSLSTAGPKITGLPDGRYLVPFGCNMFLENSGTIAWASVKINSTEATDDDAVGTGYVQATSGDPGVPAARILIVTLDNNGDNSLEMRHKTSVSTATAHFSRRWLMALKFANT